MPGPAFWSATNGRSVFVIGRCADMLELRLFWRFQTARAR